MNDLTIPDAWREQLASYPRELVFAALAVTTFVLLLLLTRRPRVVLKGVLVLGIGAVGLVAGVLGTRAGVWAGRNDERGTVILGGVAAILLVLALRARGTVKRVLAHRRLVADVQDDPQKLLVLALAPEISVNARRRAVKLLGDPFTLDEIARRSRTSSVKKLARRRLERVRDRTPDAATEVVTGRTKHPRTRREAAEKNLEKLATPPTEESIGGSTRHDAVAEELLPESFYLPPDEER